MERNIEYLRLKFITFLLLLSLFDLIPFKSKFLIGTKKYQKGLDMTNKEVSEQLMKDFNKLTGKAGNQCGI